MKYLAAYALLVLGGNENPSADDIKKVLSEVGITADDAQLTALLDAMKGKKLHEVISAGLSKVQIAAPSSAQAKPAAQEEKKPEAEKKEEEKKEEGVDLGGAMNLFGDD